MDFEIKQVTLLDDTYLRATWTDLYIVLSVHLQLSWKTHRHKILTVLNATSPAVVTVVFEVINPCPAKVKNTSHLRLNLGYQSKNKLSAKHVVEEAMSNALIRKCNKCKNPFLKESGCNKMKCMCGNTQCFVCSSDVTDYTHFTEMGEGEKCPLYGDTDALLTRNVATAQEQTIQRLLATRTSLNDDDVRVDRSLKAEASLPADSESDNEPQIGWERVNEVLRGLVVPLLYRCRMCLEEFGSWEELRQHLATENHWQRRPGGRTDGEHRCRTCHRVFGSWAELRQHLTVRRHWRRNFFV